MLQAPPPPHSPPFAHCIAAVQCTDLRHRCSSPPSAPPYTLATCPPPPLPLPQDVFGLGLGRAGDVALLLELGSVRGPVFTTSTCDVEEDVVHVSCASPAGVGAVAWVVMVVDGVRSDPLPTPWLTYTPPFILTISGPGAVDAPSSVRLCLLWHPCAALWFCHSHTCP
jgi:hypothetical protein